MADLNGFHNILFDLDGTLVDSSATIGASIAHALQRMEIPADRGPAIETLIGLPLYDIFVSRFGMDEASALEAIDHYRIHYDQLKQAGSRVYDRVQDDLADLKAAGARLFIATVKPTPIAEKVLLDLDLRGYFDGVAGASMGPERRDKERIIAFALDTFRLQPDHSLMVGDRDQDINGARANGLRSVGVTYGFGSQEEIDASAPDFTVHESGRIFGLLKG